MAFFTATQKAGRQRQGRKSALDKASNSPSSSLSSITSIGWRRGPGRGGSFCLPRRPASGLLKIAINAAAPMRNQVLQTGLPVSEGNEFRQTAAWIGRAAKDWRQPIVKRPQIFD